jgi:hypothetical protein
MYKAMILWRKCCYAYFVDAFTKIGACDSKLLKLGTYAINRKGHDMEKESSLWKTKQLLSKMVLAASGWEQGSHEAETASGPMVWCYMYDLPTKWTWLCAINREMFVKMSEASHNDQANVQSVRAGVAVVSSMVADGAPPSPLEGLDWEQQLGGLLSLYAGTTQIWEVAQRFVPGGHFIVLNYRKAGKREGLLRPFAMAPSESVLPAAELQHTIAQVLANDRARHPEWFA